MPRGTSSEARDCVRLATVEPTPVREIRPTAIPATAPQAMVNATTRNGSSS